MEEFWNQGISEKTREADAQRSKPSLAQIEAAVQPIIEAMAERFNMSFNFGFRNAEGSIRFAAGPDNRCLPQSPEGCTPTNMSAHTKIPGGSVTKAMTVTRVLQLAEEGLIDLDKAAHLYSDPVTTKLYGWTLAQLWETPAVNKITVRDLMGMTSGLRDYAYMPHSPSPGVQTLSAPWDDSLPDFYLTSADKTLHGPVDIGYGYGYMGKNVTPGFVNPVGNSPEGDTVPNSAYAPGASATGNGSPNGAYSGLNFIILGWIMTHVTQQGSWTNVDQIGVFANSPPGRYNETAFAALGRCRDLGDVAHQYMATYKPESSRVQILDMIDASCLNGWTMGNVVSSGENLATFFYDQWTLGSGLLSESAMLQIVSYFKPLYDWTVPDAYRGRTEWWIYGLGTFLLPTDRYLTNFTDENRGKVRALGHPGQDWGSADSPVCNYFGYYKFGVCMIYNSNMGLTRDTTWGQWNGYAASIASMKVLDAVMALYGGPRFDVSDELILSGKSIFPKKYDQATAKRLVFTEQYGSKGLYYNENSSCSACTRL